VQVAAHIQMKIVQLLSHISGLEFGLRFLARFCIFGISSVSFSFAFGQQLPSGFKIERYAPVWERNPFTLVTPAPAEKHVSAFDNLFLASWLKDGSKEVVLVQTRKPTMCKESLPSPTRTICVSSRSARTRIRSSLRLLFPTARSREQ
jgi:hypothetical protein